MPASPRFFTISDIANRLDLSSRTVRRWIDDRLLVAHRIRGVVRISEADFAAFIAGQRDE
jgi:excisionase family DNA binding protein